MSDHVKRVANWSNMAYHIYDRMYQCVMTIACCDFQSDDKECFRIFGITSTIIARHGFSNLHFKNNVTDNAQTNLNNVRIVYGLRDPNVPIDGRKKTYYIHQTLYQPRLARPTKAPLPPMLRRFFYVGG
jgi:hypothetical protein